MDRQLPRSALIDTGVLLRFLEEPEGPETEHCITFCERMAACRNTIFVAAPTICEVARHRGCPVPHQDGIVVVPFDQMAANLLGTKMQISDLKKLKSDRCTLTYLKYDALIAGCMLRCRAEVMVALDSDHTKIAGHLGYDVVHPEAYAESETIDMFSKPANSRGAT